MDPLTGGFRAVTLGLRVPVQVVVRSVEAILLCPMCHELPSSSPEPTRRQPR